MHRRNQNDKASHRAGEDIQALTTAGEVGGGWWSHREAWPAPPPGGGIPAPGPTPLTDSRLTCLEVAPAFREDLPSGGSTFDWPVTQQELLKPAVNERLWLWVV